MIACRARVAAVATACLAAAAACTPSDDGAAARAASPRTGLREVVLPDVSGAEPAVRIRLRDEHEALMRRAADPGLSSTAVAEAYGSLGRLLLAAEFYGAAEAAFANAEALAPGAMQWPYYLGHVFRARSDTSGAVAAFERAVARQPGYVPALVWLAKLQLDAGRPDVAKAHLMAAQSIAAREPSVLYGLGRVALAAQDFAAAGAYFEQALELAPSASSLRYQLALAYRGLGDRARAEAQLRLSGATDLVPTDPLMAELAGLLQNAAAFETRGAQAMAERRWGAAVSELRQAVARAPANAFTHLNLGTSLYMTGERAGALDAFRTAVRLSPRLAKAHFAIGVLMETDGRDVEAIAAFARAVDSDATYGEARVSLADALRRAGRTEEALPHYDAALRADPGQARARFGQAMALVRLRRYAEARQRLEGGADAFPEQPGFAHALARLLAAAPDDRLRDGHRSLSIMQGLLRTQPRSLPLVETMAMALAEVGRFDDAVEWQRDAVAAAGRSNRGDASSLSANLRRYENRQPCRVPWADDDPVHRPPPSAP